jgi:MerR family transcriptional regulator, mercuric resistance operon regulatory protein
VVFPNHRRVDAGLTARAKQKLAEVGAKIADLEVIAATLGAAIAAGCEDLVECAGNSDCPISFATMLDGARK